ncbi:intracellular coagulation inhibitor 1-like isoform X1 [Tachypleus tridentatus]|uniref:intracellular coagulation inhibitor 1-like isoform X1 n=2 Tax=Tachypleus tridentatus TaxID=6853 RepID=UPI003FCFB7F8
MHKMVHINKMALLFWTIAVLVVASCVAVMPSGEHRNSSTEEDKVVEASNRFAVSLFKELNKKGNIIISPWSLSTVLGMAYLGANGSTAQEMEDVLEYRTAGIEGKSVHNGFKKQHNILNDANTKNEVSSVNVALINSEYEIAKSYKDYLELYYNSTVKELNFTQADSVLQWVNTWGYWASRGKITKMLTETPPKETRLMLLNGVYFKGNWLNPFNPEDTRLEDFLNDDGKTVMVPMMHMTESVAYTEDVNLGVYAASFPYEGENMSMIILLPAENYNLTDVENRFTPVILDDILSSMNKYKIKIGLPKFELKNDHKLKDVLQSLGMQSAFSKHGADFSGITGTYDLYVDEIFHKTFIRVNEEGTEAAANTVIQIHNRRKLPEFFVNRPFLFVIRDNRNGIILSWGVSPS